MTPGERYAYRLGYWDGDVREFTEETWVDVPLPRLAFAVHGFEPNPARGSPAIGFSLPDAGAALLEAFDARGRRVWREEVGGLGPGRHVVRPETELVPGICWIRLVSGETSRQAKGVVLH